MTRRPRAAFTLIEVLVAMAILSLLGTALVMILRGGLSTWRRSEARRTAYDQAQAVFRQLREDLGSATPPRDPAVPRTVESRLLCDLAHPENALPAPAELGVGQRLLLVRSLKGESEHPITGHAGSSIEGDRVVDMRDDLEEARAERLRATGGQMEVAWVLGRSGVLYRGVRAPIGAPGSLFEDGAYELAPPPGEGAPAEETPLPPGVAPPSLLRPFAGDVIHFELRFWSQYTSSWRLDATCRWDARSDQPSGPLLLWDSTRSLDLWAGQRLEPDAFTTFLGASSRDDPRDDLIPTKARALVVFREEPAAGSVSFLSRPVAASDDSVYVQEPERLRAVLGDGDGAGFVYIGGEWIAVEAIEGDRLVVPPGGRGARWTQARDHDTGELVHVGRAFVSILDLPGRVDLYDPVRRQGVRR